MRQRSANHSRQKKRKSMAASKQGRETGCRNFLNRGRTHATFQRNILQPCCAQRVTRVWPHRSNMLQDDRWCWIEFENGQIFVATFLDVARCCARLVSSFTTSHNTIQQCCKIGNELILAGKLQLKKLQKKKPEKNSGFDGA